MKTLVFDIEKFAVHDGPGIRTAVFMKGCPLRCIWCHNPESHEFHSEVFFNPDKCIGCSWCVEVCPRGCHRVEDGKHIFDRTNCIRCMRCTEKCYSRALETAGKLMSVEEVMTEVLKDKIFYDNSGGGITLSGGEPLANFEFTRELLTAARAAGIHTAVETCGFASTDKIEQLLPLVDLWLWDVKAAPHHHKELTGVDNDLILKNLHFVGQNQGSIILRCPLIPGVNDFPDDLKQIADLANTVPGVIQIDIEPYHPLGKEKNGRLGKDSAYSADFAPKEMSGIWQKAIAEWTSVPITHP